MSNIVIANFKGRHVAVTQPVYQYNVGMILRFQGITLPSTYRVDFSNAIHGDSKAMIGNASGVEIPFEYFVPGQRIYAWIVLSYGANDAITEYQITIPVSSRAKPSEETPTPTQQSVIDQTIAALNSGVERAEAAADEAEQAVSDVQETVDTALQEAKESGEFDGVSPTVDVALITGGHRITITDADGSHIVDVMDGTDGRGVVSIEKTGTAGLVDTYTITYTDNTTATFTVTNGADGSPGASAYVWIRYAATEPTQDSDMKTTPDAWIGIYSGDSATAPTAYTAYTWYNIKGQTGPVQDVQVNGISVVQDGVANVPQAGNQTFGVIKAGGYGVYNYYGNLRLESASESQNKTGTDTTKAITPSNQHSSTFYGLAKAAGDTTQSQSSNAVGNYTDAAKSAISTMLNGPISVSGTTPSIQALSGIQYVCGECATLDITLPASGCVDVVFESGSTPTVLTITPQTGMTAEWANGFDSTALEADTLYELNIKMVGTKCLGVAGQWT